MDVQARAVDGHYILVRYADADPAGQCVFKYDGVLCFEAFGAARGEH